MRLVEHLDPSERLGEILFGLIMVLTFTLGAGLNASEGREGVRELLIAAVGCNVAWGFIDGVMVVMNRMSERARRQRIAREIRAAGSPAAALEVVRRELHSTVGPFVGPEMRDRLYAEVCERAAALAQQRIRLERNDLLAGVAGFWLVFFSALPAAFPFLLLSDPHRALRVSNALLLALIFLAGWRWASYTGGSRLGTGLVMLSIGTVLVVVAIALGG